MFVVVVVFVVTFSNSFYFINFAVQGKGKAPVIKKDKKDVKTETYWFPDGMLCFTIH